jgi:hypothetical protein
MFKQIFGRKPAPLTGAPAVRRVKTYSAQSGYSYEYYYLGQRPSRRRGESGSEYVFSVSAARQGAREVAVFVSGPALAAWEAGHGRTLADNERFAVAKMALLQAFDERDTPRDVKGDVHVRAIDVEAILERLGME